MPAMEVGTSAGPARGPVGLPESVKELLNASTRLSIPLELKILSALLMLFLFLLFLIMVLWDRYGKEIGELYTSPMGTTSHGGDAGGDVKVHDVADEYTVYQKLPTFFYEYMPRRKKTN
ncbi:hypothetical protein PHYBOEH_000093 [Phytophthora boehmeriae]|uniref:Uncharacterized protein n=1 Tax=Phytophthora boehmeriae TaxID=109152 RepID=A0A8T1X8L8_9STRA|nr:hypothetical protein PHYBOEH_000093 [Phytophthora boehmeriae]